MADPVRDDAAVDDPVRDDVSVGTRVCVLVALLEPVPVAELGADLVLLGELLTLADKELLGLAAALMDAPEETDAVAVAVPLRVDLEDVVQERVELPETVAVAVTVPVFALEPVCAPVRVDVADCTLVADSAADRVALLEEVPVGDAAVVLVPLMETLSLWEGGAEALGVLLLHCVKEELLDADTLCAAAAERFAAVLPVAASLARAPEDSEACAVAAVVPVAATGELVEPAVMLDVESREGEEAADPDAGAVSVAVPVAVADPLLVPLPTAELEPVPVPLCVRAEEAVAALLRDGSAEALGVLLLHCVTEALLEEAALCAAAAERFAALLPVAGWLPFAAGVADRGGEAVGVGRGERDREVVEDDDCEVRGVAELVPHSVALGEAPAERVLEGVLAAVTVAVEVALPVCVAEVERLCVEELWPLRDAPGLRDALAEEEAAALALVVPVPLSVPVALLVARGVAVPVEVPVAPDEEDAPPDIVTATVLLELRAREAEGCETEGLVLAVAASCVPEGVPPPLDSVAPAETEAPAVSVEVGVAEAEPVALLLAVEIAVLEVVAVALLAPVPVAVTLPLPHPVCDPMALKFPVRDAACDLLGVPVRL